MAKKEPKSTQPEKERAFLVGVFLRSEPQLLGLMICWLSCDYLPTPPV